MVNVVTTAGQPDGRVLRRSKTRRLIYSAAEDLFASRGFEGASLGMIAEAAGVSKGTIFYNFENKLALYERLLARRLEQLRELIVKSRGKLHGEEALNAVTLALMAAIDARPSSAQLLLNEVFRGASDTPVLLELRGAVTENLGEIFTEISINRHGPELATPPSPARDTLAVGLLGALVLTSRDRVSFNQSLTLEEAHFAVMRGLDMPVTFTPRPVPVPD